MKNITLVTTVLVLGSSILSIAHSAPPADVPTAVVKFADLDTGRPAGQEALYRRLTQAARTVCRSLNPSESGAKGLASPLYTACVNQALSGAVAKINLPEFTDYVAFRASKPAGAMLQLAAR